MTTLQLLLVTTVIVEAVLLLYLHHRRTPAWSVLNRWTVPLTVLALLAAGLFLLVHGATGIGDIVIGVACGAAGYESLRP